MPEQNTKWTDEVRPVPGGWITKAVLLIIFFALMLSDVLHGDVDLANPKSWFELVVPYTPLLALLVGVVPGIAVWFAVLALIISLGAPSLLLSATALPMILTVGFGTFSLPKRAAWVFAGITAALLACAAAANQQVSAGLLVLGSLAVLAGMAGLGANTFRTRSEHADEQVAQLQKQQQEIRNRERTQLAHELHDIIAHDVTIIAMQARRAEFVTTPEKTREILDGIGDAASKALQDLRSLVVLLKTEDQTPAQPPPDSEINALALDTPELSGETTAAVSLIHDLRNVADAMERAGFPVQLDVEGSVSQLPASLRQALRRTVRELGTNALKHGAPGSTVQLRLIVDDAQVTLSSTNRVTPRARLTSSGTGLEAMRARVEIFSGQVRTNNEGGEWTTTMTIPLEQRSVTVTMQGAEG